MAHVKALRALPAVAAQLRAAHRCAAANREALRLATSGFRGASSASNPKSILAGVAVPSVSPQDAIHDLVALLRLKLPKGFGDNIPGGSTSAAADKPSDASEEASSAAEKKEKDEKDDKEGGGGFGGWGGGGGGKKDDKKSSKKGGDEEPQHDPLAILIAASVALYAGYSVYAMRGGGGRGAGAEISWQEFRNTYLATGMVDRLEVVNKEFVRVHLRNTPNPAFLEAQDGPSSGMAGKGGSSSSSSSSGNLRAESSGSGSDAVAGLVDDLGLQGSDTEAELRKAMEASRSHRSPVFRIGSVDGFERQLEDSQLDLRVRPRDFVLVRHVSEADLASQLAPLIPYAILIGLYLFAMRAMSGGAGGGIGIGGGGGGGGGPGGINRVLGIGKAKPTVVNKDAKVKVTFKDVAGCDEAKAEIMEFVQFLKDPAKFTALGAKIPKGALLVGPPGTGKTLLAKATAGESGTPFFSMSGSDFIEMFVGVGPSRVRDLFAQARAAAPCIIFIDEIDAVARARNKGGFSGGNDERENTLNQLLVEMDGFATTEGVVVLAGTNRVDILDKAILRPGRFDRQITVDKPDIKGRREIFNVHMKPIKVGGDRAVYAQRLAALTPGFVGADIANICNEAAIHAARKAKTAVDMKDFEAAVDRVIGGLERRNAVMTPEERRTVAFHEAGHAIAGWFLEHADPLLKVTIIPRGNGALGFAQYLPKEVTLYSREALLDRMCMALGGRASEELNFAGRITTGASDDLDRVTQMAYAMTAVYGMNARVGTLSFPRKEEQQFDKPYSEETARMIDEEVRTMVSAAYERTKALLTTNAAAVKAVAELLLEKETINQNDLARLAGPRPFAINPNLKQYVETMFDEPDAEEKKKKPTSAADEAAAAAAIVKKAEEEGGPIPAPL